MEYTERVDGFQIRDVVYIGLPPKGTSPKFDVVKWVTLDPPLDIVNLETGKKQTITEHCYTVGWLEWDEKGGGFDFKSCGLRWLEADPTQAVINMVLDFADKKAEELERENDD